MFASTKAFLPARYSCFFNLMNAARRKSCSRVVPLHRSRTVAVLASSRSMPTKLTALEPDHFFGSVHACTSALSSTMSRRLRCSSDLSAAATPRAYMAASLFAHISMSGLE